jgi:hypothetical protein
MNKEKITLTDDVAVFVLENGSHYKGAASEGKYFGTIIEIMNKLQAINNVESDKIGFGGTKLDIAAFFANLLSVAEFQMTEFTIQRELSDDFDPDTPVQNEI